MEGKGFDKTAPGQPANYPPILMQLVETCPGTMDQESKQNRRHEVLERHQRIFRGDDAVGGTHVDAHILGGQGCSLPSVSPLAVVVYMVSPLACA